MHDGRDDYHEEFIRSIVTDNITGLMWTQDAYLAGDVMNWYDAIDWCNALVHGGYSDWRLPNMSELFSLNDISLFISTGSAI